MNVLLADLRAALPPGVDPLEVLVDYVADHPRDREAFGLLIEAVFEGRRHPVDGGHPPRAAL